MITSNLKADFLKGNLAFLDGQTLKGPSPNDQLGFDFQGLRRSFREDPKHPDSSAIAQFGRVWIYDVALSIYADLKAGRGKSAGYQAKRVVELARREQEKGFRGLWHFSYNTLGDIFIDPRGPAGANAWCLNALYATILSQQDRQLLAWANEAVKSYLFELQVMSQGDPRFGLIRAGLHNADEIARGDAMGYRVYEGNLNKAYEHVILEHCADAAGTFRLAYRATRKLLPGAKDFLAELIHRHDLLLQGMRRCFWQKDHFVSALDEKGKLYTGTDGEPSVAVDNNTWSAHLFLPYDLDLAQAAIRYVQDRFLVQAPPAHIEDLPAGPAGDISAQENLEGFYYFPSTFMDPFVQVPPEYRAKMEKLFQPEATFGFVLLLRGLSDYLSATQEKNRCRERAEQLFEKTIKLQNMYGPSGAPYASANIPLIFSTLHSVTTAASGIITSAILEGASDDDFIGVAPPQEFAVAGQSPHAPTG